jgi:hypothetical protein
MSRVFVGERRSNRNACRRVIVSLFCCIAGCDGVFMFSGVVVDRDKKPIANATVELDSDVRDFGKLMGNTDDQGAFSLVSTISPGSEFVTVSVAVSREGFVPIRMRLPLGVRSENVEIEMAAQTAM